MAIPIPTQPEKNFAPVPAGTYAARCYKIIHIGTIQENLKGEDKILNKLIIYWELPTELKEFKAGQGPKPYTVMEKYNISMNENSNFRKMIESWKGITFTPETMKTFEIASLLGETCQITVKHNPSGDKVYANVAAVTPLMKGFHVPPQVNESFLLDYDNFTLDKFDAQPQFIKDMMVRSLEYAALQNNNEQYYNQSQNDVV